MRSLVCKLFAMALGALCLVVVLHRPSAADEEQAAQEQKQVIVFQSDDGKSVQEQQQVIVVKADDKKADVAEALKKALHRKLGGMSADIREKIQQKLKNAKEARIEVIVVGSDGEAQPVEHSASAEEHTATVVADAFPAGDEKHVAVAVAVEGQELKGDDQPKTITVTVKDGEVQINGKPVKAPALKEPAKGEITWEFKADAETGALTGEVKVDEKKQGERARKAVRRRMLFVPKEGEAKSFDVDVDTSSGGVAVGKAYVVYGDAKAKQAETPEGAVTYEVTIAGDEGTKKDGGPRKIELRALKAPATRGEAVFEFVPAAPGCPMPHVVPLHHPVPPGPANAEFAKRLKGIESELKQIRKLLEEMQKENAD